MRNFTHNFAIHSLSKKVLELIEELEHPRHPKHRLVQRKFIDELYNKGHLNKQEHIFMTARIILNDFCEEVEQHIGRGARAGVLFYCQDRKLLCYAAGSHYPQALKDYCVMQAPSLDLESSIHYTDDIFRLQDIDDWYKKDEWDKFNFVPLFKDCGVKSMLSKRMRMNGFTFGTLEVYFPDYGGVTDEEVQWIREKLQPVKEQLSICRVEMIDALEHAIDRLGDGFTHNPPLALSKNLIQYSVALVGIQLCQGAFPLAGKLINMV